MLGGSQLLVHLSAMMQASAAIMFGHCPALAKQIPFTDPWVQTLGSAEFVAVI